VRRSPLPSLAAASLCALALLACPKRRDTARIPERDAPKSCEELPDMIWSELPRPDAGTTDGGSADGGLFQPLDSATDAGT
jgi:hypothetical protein